MSSAPIGVFDSGLGGLTVAQAIFERLPHESTLYFGDTARVPYGPKSADTVCRYSLEIMQWLLGQGVKAIVVACNTSTAHALEALRTASPVPVVGVIEPGARAAVKSAGVHPIGVIGTTGTIKSKAYERAIHQLAPEAEIISRACPLLGPLVEEGWFNHPATELVAEEYLAPVRAKNVRALVLGCTHYPLLRRLLQEVIGHKVKLIDSAKETALALEAVLAREGLAAASKTATHRFVVSDDPERFRRVGAGFLGHRVAHAEVVSLGTG
ncbi:MAG TPA: glutamate racemase [Gemmatimonadales bacterium]|nr:glutamate racemase [Gemmatimonadales bacterium]